MNVKPFMVDALTSALELGIGTAVDVVKHVTPDVLAQHLPRPLWARLLTACLGAPKVDAQLVVETVGVANLVEHVPVALVWACISELAQRALGKAVTVPEAVAPAAAKSGPAKLPLAPPPPDEKPVAPAQPVTPARGVAIPAVAAQPAAAQPRFRQTGTGLGGGSRIGQPAARRPQLAATVPRATTATPAARRGSTEPEADTSTASEIAVDDSQLVDWSTETTDARDEDFSDIGRKR